MKKAIVIANGDYFKFKNVLQLQKIGFSDIICADGGANKLIKKNMIPKFIIGDLDSIKAEVLEFYKNQTEVIKISSQDDTDIEKTIKFLMDRNYTELVIISATGERLDHSIGNLSILLKFADKLNLHLIHGKSILSVISGKVKLKAKKGEVISLFAFDDQTKITTKGLMYQLKNESLTFGKRESISNVATENTFELSIKNGFIFIIRDLKYFIKYGN